LLAGANSFTLLKKSNECDMLAGAISTALPIRNVPRQAASALERARLLL
jgi:hypothetical protein